MKKVYLILVAIILSVYSAYGVIASPEPFVYTQSDGSKITLYNQGDEFYHWVETSNRDIVVNNNGYYEYATIVDGDIVPSGIRVSNQQNASQKSTLAQREEIINLMLQKRKSIILRMDSLSLEQDTLSSNGGNPAKSAPQTMGELKVLCILIGSPDMPFSKTQANFANMWNQVGYNYEGSQGSVKDFYYENSLGYTNVTATVVGPYTASHNSSYYDTGSNIGTSNVRELIQEALVAAKNDVQFSYFDVNGDKYVDAVHVVFAGYGKESALFDGVIWSHHWSLSSPVWQGLYKAQEYFCTPELAGFSGTLVAPIGTVCHEYGHNLGAPDFYDVSSSGYPGTGHWDVMASGNWNNDGRCPAHHNPYTKVYLYSWLFLPHVLIPAHSNNLRTLTPSHNNNSIYWMTTNTSGEFFMLENKKKLGFNSHIPVGNNDGLLIYHIHSDIQNAIDNNLVNAMHPQKCYIVNANATSNPNSNPSSYGTDESQWAFPTNNQIFFTANSTPSATSWAGDATGVNICFIQKSGNNIKFVVNPKINGPSILDSLETYSVSHIPECAQIKWTYTANVQPSSPPVLQMLYRPVTFPDGTTTDTISVKRGYYRVSNTPFDSLLTGPKAFVWKPYTGTVTLKATITCAGDTFAITKTITLPAEDAAKSESQVSEDQQSSAGISESVSQTSYSLIHENPVKSRSIPVYAYKSVEESLEPLDETYTIEIWDNKYGCLKRETGTSFPIFLNADALPAGVYQIVLLVKGEIKATSKIVLY